MIIEKIEEYEKIPHVISKKKKKKLKWKKKYLKLIKKWTTKKN